MTVSLVNSTTHHDFEQASFNMSYPSGGQTGDYVFFIWTHGSSGTPVNQTAQAGFTLLGNAAQAYADVHLWYKPWDSSLTGTFAITSIAAYSNQAVCFIVRGAVHPTQWDFQKNETGATTTVTAPSVHFDQPGLLVSAFVISFKGSQSFSTPTGMTELCDIACNGGSVGESSLAVDYQTMGVGNSGTRVSTAAVADVNVTFSVAIEGPRPAYRMNIMMGG